MKVRKVKPTPTRWRLVASGAGDNEQWWLSERVSQQKLPDGTIQTVLTGKVIDVTAAVAPALAGDRAYLRWLEDKLMQVTAESYAARGLTMTDAERSRVLEAYHAEAVQHLAKNDMIMFPKRKIS